MDWTNFSKIVSVSLVPEQHSSFLTGGLGGDKETCTDKAVMRRRAIFAACETHIVSVSIEFVRQWGWRLKTTGRVLQRVE